MKGDFSRDTFSPHKHYNAVLMQQGRVQLDADWNEQRAIDRYRIETEARDLIGPEGGRVGSAGFEIGVSQDGQTLMIGPGDYYVDGILCQNEEPVPFEGQPDLPGTRAINLLQREMEVGLVYLDVWEQHVTGLEDGAIREVALGGPDTATRSRTVWQAKMLPVEADTSDIATLQPLLDDHARTADKAELARINNRILEVLGVDSDSSFEEEITEKNPPSTGQLLAQALPPASAESPCVLPPSAGYERLENQLYRVEIHDGGERGDAKTRRTFKWSRDNGSVETAVLGVTPKVTGAEIAVRDLGRDEPLGFAEGQYVEFVSDNTERFGLAGPLLRIAKVDPATRTITVDQPLSNINPDSERAIHYKLRRWDSTGALEMRDGEFVDLEGSIQVRFTEGRYNTGDYWLIPARTATGAIEWPYEEVKENDQVLQRPLPQPPAGVRHRHARLALVMAATVGGEGRPPEEPRTAPGRTGGEGPPTIPGPRERRLVVLSDCRRLHPPVTELTSLFYLSGDGQEAGSGQPLPRPLVVGVANGNKPVPGARVRFAVQTGGHLEADGETGSIVTATTDARGEARCFWTLATDQPSQQVRASLLDGTHLSVYFNADLSAAGEAVAESIQITKLLLGQPGQKQEQELRVDGRVSVASLANGIQVVCNKQIDEQTVAGKPTCFVTLQMPYPRNEADVKLWDSNPAVIGFQPLILAAQVSVGPDGKRIVWTPEPATGEWLRLNKLFQKVALPELTAHLTLKGNFIWDKKPNQGKLPKPLAYLDGETFATRRPGGPSVELEFPSGDGRRGGDFEMWFRLVPPTLQLDFVTLNEGEAVGGTQVRGTVRISGAATGSGATITLTSALPPGVVSVPSSVTIPAGESSAEFQVTTQAVGTPTTVKITATLTDQGTTTRREVNVVVQPPTLMPVELTPNSTFGKTDPVQGRVELNGPAPAAGVSVKLSSNLPSIARPRQPSVNIPPGIDFAEFQVDTEPVSGASLVKITAEAQGGTQTATLAVHAPEVSELTLDPPSVLGGSTSTATLKITGPAPPNFAVALASSDMTRATMQGNSITVPVNSTSVPFTVYAHPVPIDGGVTIRATRAGVQRTATLTVQRPALDSFGFSPELVKFDEISVGIITLNGPAPSGTSVKLKKLGAAQSFVELFPKESVPVQPGVKQTTFTAIGRDIFGAGEGVLDMIIEVSYLGKTKTATLRLSMVRN